MPVAAGINNKLDKEKKMTEYTAYIFLEDGSRAVVRIRERNIDEATILLSQYIPANAKFILVPGRSISIK